MKIWKSREGSQVLQLLSGRCNVFLIQCDETFILVDTSTKQNRLKLKRRIEGLGLNKIDFLILTHTHFDHASNAYFIQQKYGAKVIVHQHEAENLATGTNILPNGTLMITRFLVNTFGKRNLKRFNFEPCKPDILFNDQSNFPGFENKINLIHTPGHTLGCISVIVDNEFAIVGDAMFGVFPGSIFPPYGNDIGQLVNSWGKLLETGCSLFFPAHGSVNRRHLVQKEFDQRKIKNHR